MQAIRVATCGIIGINFKFPKSDIATSCQVLAHIAHQLACPPSSKGMSQRKFTRQDSLRWSERCGVRSFLQPSCSSFVQWPPPSPAERATCEDRKTSIQVDASKLSYPRCRCSDSKVMKPRSDDGFLKPPGI